MSAPTLVPCSRCVRHVRASDLQCPFCDATLPDALRTVVHAMPTQRLNRAALIAFGATLNLAACEHGESVRHDSQTIMQPYGAPPMRETPDAPSPDAVDHAVGADGQTVVHTNERQRAAVGVADEVGSPASGYGAAPAQPERDAGAPHVRAPRRRNP